MFLNIGLMQDMIFRREDIISFMEGVDNDFIPPIASRVNYENYVDKLYQQAVMFIACRNNVIMGLAACYCNDMVRYIADLSYIDVHKEARGMGIGRSIMLNCMAHARKKHMQIMRTKTAEQNNRVIDFYLGLGFKVIGIGDKRPDGSNGVLLEADLSS